MAKLRSPNYPNMSLGPALEAIRAAYKAENRNKMSRTVLAKHLGYNSLNGRALGKIGAIRAYGLIDGSGDELRVSDDAITALMAPAGSQERTDALGRLAHKPTLFQELFKDFPDTMPSLENLKYSLVKRQFTPEASEKAAKSYLATMNLVAGIPDAYNGSESDEEESDGMQTQVTAQPRTGRRSEPAETVHATGLPLRVVMNGNRLDIQASVDLAGLKKLQEMLAKYESILEMMSPNEVGDGMPWNKQ
jgi:hypothetical protein